MKKNALILFLLVFSLSAFSQSYDKLIAKAGDNENFPKADYVTVFDSTNVFMEESGLSYVNMHQ